jgi:hypothetical protein
MGYTEWEVPTKSDHMSERSSTGTKHHYLHLLVVPIPFIITSTDHNVYSDLFCSHPQYAPCSLGWQQC